MNSTGVSRVKFSEVALMRGAVPTLLVLLLTSFAPVAAQAQSAQWAPLAGSVRVNDMDNGPSQYDNLLREALPLAARLYRQRAGYSSNAQYDNVDPYAFQSPPSRAARFTQQVSQQQGAPYIWCQSGEGGYYDSTGNAKQRVWANELYRFGGRFQDGTPVPAQPITNFNSMGHAFKTAITGGPSFWDH
jgi:hypothetical protein